MIYILLFAGVFLFSFYSLLAKKKKATSPLLVRAKGHFLLGNVADFKGSVLLQTLAEFPQKYGPFVETFLLTKRLLLITDPASSREILNSRPKKFERSRATEYSTQVLHAETGLFNAHGSEWLRIRKATAPSFSNLNLSHKVTAVGKEIFAWIQQLRSDPNLSTRTLDMKYEAFALTVRVITVVAFGLGADHPMCEYFVGPIFQKDVSSHFQFTGESAIFPYPRFLWKYIPSKYVLEVAAIEANQRCYEKSSKILQYKRELAKKGELQNLSMADSMILNVENATERALTDQEIIVNIRTVYMAGADTTAIALTWSTFYFATRPEILQKVRNEAAEVLFQHQSSDSFIEFTQIDVQVLASLKYTIAVLKEILRLRSPSYYLALATSREEKGPVVLKNGLTVYPDDVVYVNIEGLHHDPKNFTDPEEFRPERWLGAEREAAEAAFISFGYGPRICPGMGLAYQEGTLAIAFLAYFFDFTLNCPPKEIKRIPTFVAIPNKMPIILSLAKN